MALRESSPAMRTMRRAWTSTAAFAPCTLWTCRTGRYSAASAGRRRPGIRIAVLPRTTTLGFPALAGRRKSRPPLAPFFPHSSPPTSQEHMTREFRLLMLSAMYENGGNTTHRFLDGHPQLHVYPFESQIGTRTCATGSARCFPLKYRWPEFLLDATPATTTRRSSTRRPRCAARTPHVSKFRHDPFEMNDEERARHLLLARRGGGASRGRQRGGVFPRHPSGVEGRAPQRRRVDVRGLQPDRRRRRGRDPRRPAGRARASRRTQPMVGIRRHEEASGAALAADYMLRWNIIQHFALTRRRPQPGASAHPPHRGCHGGPGDVSASYSRPLA